MKNLKLLGFLPLFFGLWTSVKYIMIDETYQLWWFCNINNFLMALGLFIRNSYLVYIATVWLIIGTPLWLYEDILLGQVRIHAFFVHIGSSAIGIYWLKQTKLIPRFAIFSCVIGAVLSQFSAWLFTDPKHNVNMAHDIYPTLTEVFPSYLAYNVFNYVCFFFLIWIITFLFKKLILDKNE